MGWQAVIGVEVHVQLRTGRKLFCRDRVAFGAEPNTLVCPVCLGLPGALPTLDPRAVDLAVRTALALECTLHDTSVWARKSYFYPDLPKGYQITQFDRPLATGGTLDFDGPAGAGRVRIRRVHMEEDAGKSLHDRIPEGTAVDLNRAGTPLVEIVTEPDLHTPEDVRSFLGELRQLLEFADVSDCSMEEGSLRVDANVSVRRAESAELGTKTEIKNVNSFSGIERALRMEIDRQIAVLEGGGSVRGETLLWDDHRASLRPMRSKEDRHDYRYLPDPDLPPLVLGAAVVRSVRGMLREMPRARRARFQAEYGLSSYDAGVVTQSRAGADYFETVAEGCADAKLAANWVMGPLQALLNARAATWDAPPVDAPRLIELLGLVRDGTVSDRVAKQLLDALADGPEGAEEIVASRGLEQVSEPAMLERWVDEVVAAFPDECARYREGEDRLLGFLVGQVMQRSRGRADPRGVNLRIRERLGGVEQAPGRGGLSSGRGAGSDRRRPSS
jgi:aspartyl-tRNA(Asn)/glutamyl-tRNA(Gln) amidotransferase subunit B